MVVVAEEPVRREVLAVRIVAVWEGGMLGEMGWGCEWRGEGTVAVVRECAG